VESNFAGPGETPLKVIRHQQQLGFFDRESVRGNMRMVDLSEDIVEGSAARALETIVRESKERNAKFIAVDLVRGLTPAAMLNDLALHLSRCDATSILIVDCDPLDTPPNTILSTADTVIWLRQSLDRDASVRTIQAPKVRGQQPLPGVHPLRLTWDGMHVFPRWPMAEPRVARPASTRPLSLGADLDTLLGGGNPAGDAVLVDGSTGTGKSVLAAQFVAQSARAGEPGLVLPVRGATRPVHRPRRGAAPRSCPAHRHRRRAGS